MNPQPNLAANLLDQEANYFAMCLLMPESLLRKDIAELPPLEAPELVKRLAKKYQVFEPIMAIRLGQIGVMT